MISTKVPIDYEDPATPNTVDFTIFAIDGSPPFKSANTTVTITIVDVNDNAPEIYLPQDAAGAAAKPYYSVVVHEDTVAAGDTLISVIATDLDSGANGQISYTFSANASRASERFSIASDTGDVRLVNPFTTPVAAAGDTHHHTVIPVVATDQAPEPSSRLSDQVAVSIVFIGDQDLNIMVVDPISTLDEVAFVSVIEAAVCPTGTCSAIVYNTSVADSSTETTVAYYVVAKEAAAGSAEELQSAKAAAALGTLMPTFDLVAPQDMVEILQSAPGQKALAGSSSAGGFTVSALGSAGGSSEIEAAPRDPYGGLTLAGVIAVSASGLFCLVIAIVAICWRRRDHKEDQEILRHSMYMDPHPFASPRHAPTQFLTGHPSAASFALSPPAPARPTHWVGPRATAWSGSPYGQPVVMPSPHPQQQQQQQQYHRPTHYMPGADSRYAVGAGDEYIDLALSTPRNQPPRATMPMVQMEQPSAPPLVWGGDTSHHPQMHSPAPRPVQIMMSPQRQQPTRWSSSDPAQPEWNTVGGALMRQSTSFDPQLSSTNVDEWGQSTQALHMHAGTAVRPTQYAPSPAGAAASPRPTQPAPGRPSSANARGRRSNSPEEVEYADIDFALSGQQLPDRVPNVPGRVTRQSLPQMGGLSAQQAANAEQMLMNDGDAQYFDQSFSGLAGHGQPQEQWPTMKGADFAMGATEYLQVNDDPSFAAPQRASAAHLVPTQMY